MEELRLKGEEEEGAGPSQHRPISEERPETARARTSPAMNQQVFCFFFFFDGEDP